MSSSSSDLDDALRRAASTGSADDMLSILKPFIDASDGGTSSCEAQLPTDETATSAGHHEAQAQAAMPFRDAPLSYWCHVAAPPPGPHSPLVALRLAGTERILALDGNGVYHSFRWQWRAEEPDDRRGGGGGNNNGGGPPAAAQAAENGAASNLDKKSHGRSRSDSKNSVNGGDGGGANGNDSPKAEPPEDQQKQSDLFADRGCFVAQRELAHFRSVPRLPYHPPPVPQQSLKRSNSGSSSLQQQQPSVVAAISKTLFA